MEKVLIGVLCSYRVIYFMFFVKWEIYYSIGNVDFLFFVGRIEILSIFRNRIFIIYNLKKGVKIWFRILIIWIF